MNPSAALLTSNYQRDTVAFILNGSILWYICLLVGVQLRVSL